MSELSGYRLRRAVAFSSRILASCRCYILASATILPFLVVSTLQTKGIRQIKHDRILLFVNIPSPFVLPFYMMKLDLSIQIFRFGP